MRAFPNFSSRAAIAFSPSSFFISRFTSANVALNSASAARALTTVARYSAAWKKSSVLTTVFPASMNPLNTCLKSVSSHAAPSDTNCTRSNPPQTIFERISLTSEMNLSECSVLAKRRMQSLFTIGRPFLSTRL